MKASELKHQLEHVRDDVEIVIAVELPYTTVGARPMVPVRQAHAGFDWEAGKFILTPEEKLAPEDRDFAEQMKAMQDRVGWAEYENRGLKAEIKRLKKQMGATNG